MSFQPQPQHDRQPLPRRQEAEGKSGHSQAQTRKEYTRADRNPADRSDNSENSVGGMSRALMFGLILLALVASLLMLFMDSEAWLKVAVIAALWAAFIGAVLVSRYSSALSAERDRSRQLQRSHTAELEREKSEHQKREAMLESSYEQRIRDQRDEHLEQLRQELAVMRQQLAAMSGGEFGEEQTSVRAKAERVREIENSVNAASVARPGGKRYAGSSAASHAAHAQSAPGAGSSASTATASSAAAHTASTSSAAAQSSGSQRQQQGEKKSGKRSSTFSTGTFAAIKWGGQDAMETSELPLIVDTTALDEDEAHTEAFHGVRKEEVRKDAPKSGTAPKAGEAKHSEHPASSRPHHHAANGASTIASKSDESYVGGHRRKDEAEEAKAETRRGRRRADESASGLTVAELMARFKKDN